MSNSCRVASRTATQKPSPVAVTDTDAATAERPSRAVVELVIGAATVRAVVSSERHIEATVIAKSPRQECRILPTDTHERTRRIGLFAGVGAGCTSETSQQGELENPHTHSCIMRGVDTT